MSAIWSALFDWLPTSGMRISCMALFTLAIIFIVMRIVKLVLDAIPFL